MTELTDLEICERVAEIEKLEFEVKTLYIGGPLGVWTKDGDSYKPLTDDALCHRLMIKHNVSVFYEYGYAAIIHEDGGESVGGVSLYDEPNKAICLAIIVAHG